MNLTARFLAAAIGVAVLSACGTTGEVKPETEEGAATVEERGVAGPAGEAEREGRLGPSDEIEASALPGREAIEVHPLDDPDSPLAERTIYFEYDKSEVQGRYRELIAAHAQYLADNPGAHITLEGHADERGSREYNIALGERRAESVRRLFLFQGATDEQVRTVSYGEERPVATGHNEKAWAKNRRVEIVYER